MAEGTTAIGLALTTEGDADGTDLIEYEVGTQDPETSGALTYIATHDEIASRKLAPPFWGKPFVAALLSSFIREIQILEDIIWEFLELRTLANADLPRLKVIGKLVGQARLSFDTENYRLMIEARALANRSRGRGGDILGVLNLLFGEGEYVLLAAGNATLLLTALQPIDDVGLAMVTEILPAVRAAGVGLQFFFSDGAAVNVFHWGDPWPGTDGWASVRSL
jgi:predicted transcriptional regulator